MTLTEDFIEEMVEYLSLKAQFIDRAEELLDFYRENGPIESWASAVEKYLRNRADADHDGEGYRPNEEMRLLSSMTFEEDKAYWGALYRAEAAAGITYLAYAKDNPIRIAAEEEIRQARK